MFHTFCKNSLCRERDRYCFSVASSLYLMLMKSCDPLTVKYLMVSETSYQLYIVFHLTGIILESFKAVNLI